MSGVCPCGYGFVNLKNELETVAAMQTHFEQHHKDLLPFGLNNSEAFQLLNLTYAMGQKTRKSIFRNRANQTPSPLGKKVVAGNRSAKGKERQLLIP